MVYQRSVALLFKTIMVPPPHFLSGWLVKSSKMIAVIIIPFCVLKYSRNCTYSHGLDEGTDLKSSCLS